MRDFIIDNYSWILALHLIAVMFWMAGMYYLPRLFVYHAESIERGEPYAVFERMEVNLLRIIMNPAMIIAWLLGIILLMRAGFWNGAGWWIAGKLVLVIFLTGYHGFLAVMRKSFLSGRAPYSSGFFRLINEIAPVLTIIIVILAIVQPF